jgi:hypothetical protein
MSDEQVIEQIKHGKKSIEEIMEALQAPFPAEDIEWRVSRSMKYGEKMKAIVLAYVTNRAIMNRLDEVFGADNWKNEYKEWRDKGVLCGISARIDDEWITKWDGADETNFEATKGGFSGSMKRAAVQWGIGRYLYRLDETWVDVTDKGDNYIDDKKTGVKGKWQTPKLPAWALPNHSGKQADKPKEQPKADEGLKITAPIRSKWEMIGGKPEVLEKWFANEIKAGKTIEQIDQFLTEKVAEKKAEEAEQQQQGA